MRERTMERKIPLEKKNRASSRTRRAAASRIIAVEEPRSKGELERGDGAINRPMKLLIPEVSR